MSRRRPTDSKRAPERTRRDLTRPIPREAQIVRRARWRVPLSLVAVGIAAALAAAVFVLPVRDWLRQGDDLDRRQRELATLDEVNTRLEAEIARLQTPGGVNEAAREELGFVEPGEERLSLIDRGVLPAQLPAGWPYSVVSGVITARTTVVELAPLPGVDEQ